MLFQHRMATGMLKTIMPSDVGKLNPNIEVMRSTRIARPVKPLESRPAGCTNTWMA